LPLFLHLSAPSLDFPRLQHKILPKNLPLPLTTSICSISTKVPLTSPTPSSNASKITVCATSPAPFASSAASSGSLGATTKDWDISCLFENVLRDWTKKSWKPLKFRGSPFPFSETLLLQFLRNTVSKMASSSWMNTRKTRLETQAYGLCVRTRFPRSLTPRKYDIKIRSGSRYDTGSPSKRLNYSTGHAVAGKSRSLIVRFSQSKNLASWGGCLQGLGLP
jgi:hypothetical protein